MRPILPGNPAQFPPIRAISSVPQMFTQPSNFGPIPPLRPPLSSIQPPLNQPPSAPALQPFSVGPMAAGRPPVPVNPQIVLPIRPMTPPLISSGQPLPSSGIVRPQLPVPSPSLVLGPQHNPPSNVPRPPVADFGPRSAPLFSPRPSASPPILSSAPPKMAPAPVVVRPPMPIPAPAQQSPVPLQHPPMPAPPPVPAPMVPVSPSNTNAAGAAATAPKPLRPISGDFTFQPLRTQPPSVMFSAQRAPSFRPAQTSPRPQQMQLPSGAPLRAQPPPPISLGYPSAHLTSPPQSSNTMLPPNQPGGTFSSVPNLQLGGKTIGFMPGNAPTTPGGSQIYDPFSPTASAAPAPAPAPAPTHQGGNPANNRKPETDAEYEDLMASVGVK
ncbi:hypothetical protein HPP92_025457 [Vanilla planifolia]|uniref:Uncharacterized protein n=2 Tax=Vanilla planifolia TaxID=51239 RepID=A0A835PK62_VANPL|nr:hypothetical protein HPP92_025457 [Vanilla planifolia]